MDVNKIAIFIDNTSLWATDQINNQNLRDKKIIDLNL